MIVQDTVLKVVLPHHAFHGFVVLPAIFSTLLLVVFNFYFSLHREIDQLADGHALINSYRLLY